MRLGQLARKIGTSTSEIVQFLATKNIQLEDGINTRIEDRLVTVVVEKFAPNRLAEIMGTETTAQPEAEIELPTAREELVVEEITAEVPTEPVIEEAAPVDPEKIEVIKAPKIELSGLKVLGKIELPEPKKKEEPKPEENAEGSPAETTATEGAPQPTSRPQRPQRNQNRNSQRPNREPRKNPIAQQREREAQDAKRKREEELKREKERKTQHYLKNVKVAAPIRAAKIVREDVEEMEPIEDRPKTWWGRLKKWFTT